MSINSFFGLTVLGSNPFDSSILDYLRLSSFSEDEIILSFNRFIKRDCTWITKNDVYKILRDLYKGPTPIIQQEVEDILSQCPNEKITWEEFMNGVNYSQHSTSLREKGKPITHEYELYSTLTDDRHKHVRAKYGKAISKFIELEEKQYAPLTRTQELGWDKDFISRDEKVYFPLNTSDETRYAESMIRQGEYF